MRYADTCDLACVQHPDFGTDLINHDVKWESSKDIGLFGAVEFCTRHKSAYPAMYMAWGETATSILNWVQPHDPPMGYDPTVRPPPFRISMRGCIVANSVATAVACDRNDMCPTEMGDYPLAGLSGSWGGVVNGQATGLLGVVWALVDYTVVNGDVDDTHPIQAAVVVPFEFDQSQAEAGVAVVYDPSQPSINGAAIVRWDTDNQGGTGAIVAHEQSGAPQYFMVGVGYLWDTVPDASASTSSPTSIPEMSRTFCGVPDAGRDSATPASRSAGTPTTFGGGNERTRHRDRNPSNSRARHRHRRSDLRRPDPDHVVGRPPVKGRS
jgi:hypothetical protein